jgi:hypothetical protein
MMPMSARNGLKIDARWQRASLGTPPPPIPARAVRFAGNPEGLCVDTKKPCKLSWRLFTHPIETGDRSTYTAIWNQSYTQYRNRDEFIYGGGGVVCKEKDGGMGDWRQGCYLLWYVLTRLSVAALPHGVWCGVGGVWKWIPATRKKTKEPNKALQTTSMMGCGVCRDIGSASEL